MRPSRHAVRAATIATAAFAIVACSTSDSVTSLDAGPDLGQTIVSVTPKQDTITIGAIRQLVARVTDRNGIAISTPVEWRSDNSSVASVSMTGLVTGIAVGKARVFAVAGGKADTATVVVNDAAPALIVQPDRVSIASGEQLPLTVAPSPRVANAFSALQVHWSTSDSSIATVSPDGVVTTLDQGDVTVTAALGDATGTATLAVFKNPIASVQITPTSSALYPGDSELLKAVALDADGRKVQSRSLIWTASDSAIATVSDNGQVKAWKKGIVIISVQAADRSASATVNVLNQPLSSVVVHLDASSISVGQTTQATATLTATDGSVVTDRVIAWQSSNSALATVDSRGVVTGIAPGSVTISAISDGKIGSAGITVAANVPTSLAITPATASVTVGNTAQLVAELRDANGVLISGKPVTWTSSNPAVASVDGSGLATSLAAGTSTITASSSGLTATATFTGTAVAVASVTVSPTDCTLDVGQTAQLTATVRGVNGATLADRPVTWASQNPAIATVNASGVVTAIASGSTIVTATVEGQSASIPVSVSALPPAPVATITVTLNAPSVLVGQSTQAVAVAKDAAGNVLEGRSIIWSSNDPTLASVNASGLVTALAAGSVTILANCDGKTGAATLQVDPPPPAPVASVVLTAPTTTLAPGAATQVSATLRDSTGKILTGRTIAWSTSAPTVASVSATGVVTAIAAGTATIGATSEGVQGVLPFAVTAPAPAPVATVTVSMISTSLTVGSTAQATATLRDASGNVLTDRLVTWSSSNGAVASVSSTGLVTGLSAGSTTIIATAEGKTGSVSVSVTAVSSTVINPGESIQAKVDANPGGTAFLLKAGVHRMQQVQPKSGDTFTGEAGAVMSGARLLTAFTRESGYWVASGQTQDNADRTSGDGICLADHPRCFHPEDLFFDDVPLRHVGSLGEVGAGKWYFDYAADKIYFADDPTGHRVETSVSRYAFQGTATGVTIRSLVIEKYANPLQQGAVSPAGANWLVEDNTIRLTHGEGMRIFDGARLLRNKALRNGQQGVGGVANGALIEGNEIAFNNFAGVNSNWAAGGVKINGRSGILTQDVTLRDNNVHDNVGMGLWCDFNCIRIAYDHNTVWNNTGWGIQQEIGYAATITNNTLTNNGGGVFVSTSQDVEVANNTITGKYAILGLQETRGTGVFGTLILANMNVHDNVVTLPSGAGDGQHVGVIQTNGDASVFSTRNNRFTANRYTLSGVQRPFAWLNAYRTATEWRSYGLDVTGTITP